MDQKQAEKEIEYRIGKIVLATMMAEGLISQSEYDAAQCYLGPAEKSDSRYGRSFKQLLVLSQPILQSNLRSSARAKKELKGSAAGAQRSLPG